MDLTLMLSGPNLMLAGAIFVVVGGAKAMFSSFFSTTIGQRLLPILPPILGIGGSFAGICPPGYNWQNKLIIGVIAGYVSAHSFKIGKNTFCGFGLDPVPPSPGPQVPPTVSTAASTTPVVAPTAATPAAPAPADKK
jgi:hypothetical protein